MKNLKSVKIELEVNDPTFVQMIENEEDPYFDINVWGKPGAKGCQWTIYFNDIHGNQAPDVVASNVKLDIINVKK